ncbi:MAG: hypothetical protein ACK528_05445 [Alphaproteobacteria bacterium]|jgi:hypothetical protein
MSQLSDYISGQTQQRLHSIESAQSSALVKIDRVEIKQDEISDKIDELTVKVDSALTWAQRLVLLGLAISGAFGLNYSPDKLGEALAAAVKALK